MIHGKTLEGWCASHPLIGDLLALRETAWFNPAIAPVYMQAGRVLGRVDSRRLFSRVR